MIAGRTPTALVAPPATADGDAAEPTVVTLPEDTEEDSHGRGADEEPADASANGRRGPRPRNRTTVSLHSR